MEKNKGVLVKFIGHSTFLIQSPGGKQVLIDPWVLSNPSCPDEAKKIEKLDLILITHGHGDHMPEAVTLAGKYHPWIACNFESYAGEAAGFVVEFENGYKIYHAGDTCVFGDMQLIGKIYKPDLAILPIGDHFTMGPLEASYACRLLGIKKVIPMHYATFPVLTGTPAKLRELVAGTAVEILELRPGQEIWMN